MSGFGNPNEIASPSIDDDTDVLLDGASLKPILVTGSNRSGTTWVGRMLCASGELEYIHEPFNPGLWPRPLGLDVGGHYAYVCSENERPMVPAMDRVLRFRPPALRQLRDVRGAKDLGRFGRAEVSSFRARIGQRQPLVKDPIAIFSAPWLADRFSMSVVMMIRHPAAYVSSIHRLGWNYDFQFMLDQPLLMRDLLGDYRAEIQRMVDRPAPPFEQAILLWRIFYGTVARWREERPSWSFIRHEDLAADPTAGFEALFGRLGLTFSGVARTQIADHSNESNPSERGTSESGNVRRNSKGTRSVWRGRLSADEVERVRVGVGDVSALFYSSEEW